MTQSPCLPELPKLPRLGCDMDGRESSGYDGRDMRDYATAHGLACYEAGSAAAAQAVPEKIAPVQGYTPGIPWSLHLEAYDAYCKKWSPQRALIEGGCRGGFHIGELDQFIPGWREKVSEIARLRTKVEELEAALAVAAAPTQGAEGAAPQAVVGEASGQTPALKRHALEAAKQLSEYAAAPFFPNVEVRGVVRSTTAEWWDGLAELIEGSQPLITRALRECTAPIAALTPSPTPTAPQEADALREAAQVAIDVLDHYLHGGSEFRKPAVRAINALSAALAQHQPQQGEQG